MLVKAVKFAWVLLTAGKIFYSEKILSFAVFVAY